MILNCKKCGELYKGGFICERCGTRFDDADIKEFEADQQAFIQEQNAKKQQSDNSLKVFVIVMSVVIGFFILSVLAAIFVPAFIGYNNKRKAAEERQKAAEQQVIDMMNEEENRSSAE